MVVLLDLDGWIICRFFREFSQENHQKLPYFQGKPWFPVEFPSTNLLIVVASKSFLGQTTHSTSEFTYDAHFDNISMNCDA